MKNNKFFQHESAIIDSKVKIGKKTKIWHFSHIQSNVSIGKKCTIGQNVNIASNVIIGNKVKIQNNVSVYEGVELEDFVFCGPSMVFTNVKRPRAEFPKNNAKNYSKALVKKSASIGANATILCGITIGKYSLIGAGSVVLNDVPDYALIVGNPGKQIGWVDEKARNINFNSKGVSECQRFTLVKNKIYISEKS